MVQVARQACGLRANGMRRLYGVHCGGLSPVLAIIFGVLIFVFPRLLNYLVATYLVLSGLIGLGVLTFRV